MNSLKKTKLILLTSFTSLLAVASLDASAQSKAPAPAPIVLKASTTPNVAQLSQEADARKFAVSNVTGVTFDSKFGVQVEEALWGKGVERPPGDRLVFTMKVDPSVPKSQQSFDLLAYENDEYFMTTANKAENRATTTHFVDKKPVSYTVVKGKNHFTATPEFCELLRAKTGVKSNKQLKELGASCAAFYSRTPDDGTTQSYLDAVEKVHAENLKEMRSSSANSMLPKEIVPSYAAKIWGYLSRNKPSTAQPKALPNLGTTMFTSEEENRANLAELAGACGTLWPNNEAGLPDLKAAPPARSASKPTTAK